MGTPVIQSSFHSSDFNFCTDVSPIILHLTKKTSFCFSWWGCVCQVVILPLGVRILSFDAWGAHFHRPSYRIFLLRQTHVPHNNNSVLIAYTTPSSVNSSRMDVAHYSTGIVNQMKEKGTRDEEEKLLAELALGDLILLGVSYLYANQGFREFRMLTRN